MGPGVDGSLIGTRVVAHVGFRSGGYAEFAIAPVSALHTVADSVIFAQAVAAIGTGRTAQLVLEEARMLPTDVVIIPGASGGLGSQLVQLALSIGATTVALHGGESKRAVVDGLASDAEGFFALDATDESWRSQMTALLKEREPSLLIDGVGGAASAGRSC